MKAIHLFIFSLIVVLLGSCFIPWSGEGNDTGTGNFSIFWGDSGINRAYVDQSELQNFEYKITLTGPGETQEKKLNGVRSASFTVTPGDWTVTVKGYSNSGETDPVLRLMGIEKVQIKPGRNTAKTINMYTASESDNWDDLLNNKIGGSNYISFDPINPRTEIIVLTNKPGDWEVYKAIEISRPIILIAEEDITITRGNIGGSIFAIAGSVTPPKHGSLTLGMPGMTGTITLDGSAETINTPSDDSLILIGSPLGPAHLIMNEGITLKNNTVGITLLSDIKNGGGIKITNGSFTMNGGEISGNAATGNGGGVFLEGGTFIMNNGDITSNISSGTGGGVMISFGTFYMNGGNITSNIAGSDNSGGGVYKIPGGTFMQNGGNISDNTPDDINMPIL